MTRADTEPTAEPAARRPFFTVQRLVLSVLLAAAVVGMVFAFSLHEETPPVVYTHSAIRTVYPQPGDLLNRQTTVFVELEVGYTVRALTINGRSIGADDLDVIEGLNRYSYTPGEGKLIEQFDEGRTCALAEFSDSNAPGAGLQTYEWCFSLG